jgi:DNA-binding response OmpR family regulator
VRTPKVLVVEDDESLAMVLRDALAREGYVVVAESDGRAALDRASSRRFDLVVLDLMLPGMDGYEVLKRLKAGGGGPQVLILTARGREEDRVKGLKLGADDYVVKPFSLKELLARVEARLRAAHPAASGRIRVGEAEVDLDGMVVRRRGRSQDLTKMEAGMLRLFLAHPGEVLSRKRFLDEVWGFDRYPTTRTVDVHVARVREKLGDGGKPALIATVHGVGYRFDPPEVFHPVDDDVASR